MNPSSPLLAPAIPLTLPRPKVTTWEERRKLALKGPLVTAVIGFFGNGSITIATDSQMTNESAGTKQCDSQKLNRVEFADGTSVLVARAGVIETADIFQEIFEELACSQRASDWRAIANTFEEALKRTRGKMIDGFNHPALPTGLAAEYVTERRASFLIGYMFGGHPYMYKGDSVGTVAIKVAHKFVTMGSAANIASFLLEDSHFLHLNESERVGLAAYVIEMCKRADLFCSGPVQIGSLDNTGKGCRIYDREMIERMQSAVTKTHADVRRQLGKLITQNFRKEIIDEVIG